MKLLKILALLLLCAIAYAGQSVQYGQYVLYNSTPIPTTPTNRLEFYVHNWSASGITHIVDSGATGWVLYLQPLGGNNTIIAFRNQWDNGAGGNIQIGGLTQPGVYVRCQHDPVNLLDIVEAWDVNGNRISYTSVSYTIETDKGTNFGIGYGNEPGMSVAFMRVQTTLVAPNSRPPVTYDPTNRLFEWKFDGSLADASGHGYTAAYPSGTPTYVATPYQLTIAILKTSNSNSWANVLTQRAGYPDTLDGTASYSQADGSATVTWFWQQLSGPSQLQFSSRTSGTPVISGTVFGDYLIQLTVTDVSNNQAVATADVGAVAMDSKGVIVNADPNVDALFGNLIAFGKNPWGYADYWEQHAMALRAADYAAGGWNNLQWEQTGAGTVSYYWNGIGYAPGSVTLGTSLTASITATSMTIPVASAAQIDLTSLPTRILIGAYNFPPVTEEIRICSVSGNTLTVCYDGRGQNPQAWSAGAKVGQDKVTGTGTHFLTDPTAQVCPVGGPGPTGPAAFSAGSVTLTAGSTTVTGNGTAWTSTIGQTASIVNYYVRVPATHGGVPFVFLAQNETGGAAAQATVSSGAISSVGVLYGLTGQNYHTGAVNIVITDPTGHGAVVTPNIVGGSIASYTVTSGGSNYSNPTIFIQPTQISLNRPYPADADSGTYTGYALMAGSRTLVLRGPHVYDTHSTGEAMWNATGCESETALYLNAQTLGNEFASGHDVPSLDGTLQSGYQYSVTDTTGWINLSSTGGISFYGESLGSRALYYRSGLTAALNAADVLDKNLVRSPWGNHDVTSWPELYTGGLAIGAFASAVLSQNGAQWGDLRSYSGFAEQVVDILNNGGTPNCEFDDTRDTGYAYAWLTLGAIYDPDTSPGGFRSRWINDLASMQANDAVCKRSDNSWSNGYLWNTSIGPVTLTANSRTVTGANLSPSSCTGVTTGTATVVAGSSTIAVISGSIPSTNADTLVITGTSGGVPFTGSYFYTGSGSSATLSVLWPADGGSVTWMAVNTQNGGINMMTFATGNSDYADLANNYACIYNSPTSLTLDHPWKGATGSTYYAFLSNLAGYGQQPFMLGIKTYGMGLLAAATGTAIAPYAAAYKTFNAGATQWIHDYGVDLPTLTTNYGRYFQFCEPSTVSSGTAFDFRAPGCRYGTSLNGMSSGREQDQELGNAIADFYINNPGSTNQTWGDSLYGAVWGNPAYNTGGVYYDAASDATNIGATNLQDDSINEGKWYGFFAGMGMLHRWPAVRLGGVDPPNNATVEIPFAFTGIPNATQARVTVTLPSGKSTAITCSTSPCGVTVDKRSGSVLMKLDYLNSAGVVISPGDTIPLYVPQ